MNINKYWVGYLIGILVFLNFFSTGVILSYALTLNWNFFFWIWLITVFVLFIIGYFIDKQKKVENEKE